MAQVTLNINGHAHTISCKDGQEAHLVAMGEEVERRIERAKSLGAHSGEARLLLMAALFMADELHDMGDELAAAKKVKAERSKSDRIARMAARAEEIAASAERH